MTARRAPRRLSRRWRALARGAWLSTALVTAGGAAALEIASARFTGETRHYPHGVLGDAIEYTGMQVTLSDGRRLSLSLAETGRVFEDLVPRLWDVTGDGRPELVVVETDPPVGAQLSVYGLRGETFAKLAATPHIGQTNRWLAPIGAADLDGDGAIEIAYVGRPHLARVLRVWRYRDGTLTEVASAPGFSNHRIGWDYIEGGIRDCGQGPEIVLASGDWRQVMAARLDGRIFAQGLGGYSPETIAAALDCR